MPSEKPAEIDLHVTRLLWREQARQALSAAYSALRRLFRREPRQYLATPDGHVVARFPREADAWLFLDWVHQTHEATFNFGFTTGKEFRVAQAINRRDQQADAGHAGTA